MIYAQPKVPARRFVGIAVAILVHVGIVYALLAGMASKVVEVISKPIETKLIEEVKPPPPPPPAAIPLPPPPKMVAPPPPFIPPPEVQVQATPSAQNTISAQSTDAAPSAPAARPSPAAPAAPQVVSVGVACPNSTQVRSAIKYPRDAQRDNVTGEVVVMFTVGVDGAVKDMQVTQSAAPSLDRAAMNAVRQFNCVAQGREVRVQVPFSFKLD